LVHLVAAARLILHPAVTVRRERRHAHLLLLFSHRVAPSVGVTVSVVRESRAGGAAWPDPRRPPRPAPRDSGGGRPRHAPRRSCRGPRRAWLRRCAPARGAPPSPR